MVQPGTGHNTQEEDFGKKYKRTNPLLNWLIGRYFQAVGSMVADIPARQIRRALEIGCGEGYSTQKLLSILPQDVTLEASEYVARQVPVAQARVPGVRIIQEDIYHLQRTDSSFDLVLALEVLEHLEDVSAALGELQRVTSRYVIIGVPNEPLWRILHFLAGKDMRAWGNTPGHINHWSSGGLLRLLKKNNFQPLAAKRPVPWTVVLAEKAA